MLDKLFLQGTIGLFRLCHNQQTTGTHIQPMGYDCIRITLLHHMFNTVFLKTTGYGHAPASERISS